ncbi:MAG: biopolymer transporter ExbD [Fibrobacterota bacterium]
MKFVRSRPRRAMGLNLTSLIDVLFILLIFVLVAARFEEVGAIAVDLPRGLSRELPESQTLTLTLTVEGKCFLGEEEVPFERLGERLGAEMSKARETVLVVAADRRVSWERVSGAIDAAKAAGLRRIAFRIKQ